MCKELNELTRRLLAEGYTPEDTPPGMREYEDYEGGWTYKYQTLRDMVFETPCGLLAKGEHFSNGYMSWHGIDWRPENDNPVLPCPQFPSEPCPLRHPLLESEKLCGQSDDIVYQCNCHQTDRPYTFEGSVDELHKQVWQEAERRWEIFQAAHKGRVCQRQSHYGRTSKTWRAWYRPMDCAHLYQGCIRCAVLDKELSSKKGNVFYDLRKTWTRKGFGLFPDEQRTSVEKGCKLLDQTASLTVCEAIVKYGHQEAVRRVMLEHHRDLYFDASLKIEVLNLRAARMDTRDIIQDLRDVAGGIQVSHAADNLKAAKEQKRARREEARKRRIRKAEKTILESGWTSLETSRQYQLGKLLGGKRIQELLRQREDMKARKPPEEEQLRLF